MWEKKKKKNGWGSLSPGSGFMISSPIINGHIFFGGGACIGIFIRHREEKIFKKRTRRVFYLRIFSNQSMRIIGQFFFKECPGIFSADFLAQFLSPFFHLRRKWIIIRNDVMACVMFLCFITCMGPSLRAVLSLVYMGTWNSLVYIYCIVPRCSVTFWTRPEIIPVGQFFRRWIKSINQA